MSTIWRIVAGLFIAVLLIAAGLSAAPPDGRTLSACEADVLSYQEALIKAQQDLTKWQARAVEAEGRLLLQEIAAKREAAKAKPAEPAPQK